MIKIYIYEGVEYNSLLQIRRLMPNVSLPVNPTEEQLAERGVTVVYREPQPPEPTPEEIEAMKEAERLTQLQAAANEFLLGILEGYRDER